MLYTESDRCCSSDVYRIDEVLARTFNMVSLIYLWREPWANSFVVVWKLCKSTVYDGRYRVVDACVPHLGCSFGLHLSELSKVLPADFSRIEAPGQCYTQSHLCSFPRISWRHLDYPRI